jgi:hypothetical protein
LGAQSRSGAHCQVSRRLETKATRLTNVLPRIEKIRTNLAANASKALAVFRCRRAAGFVQLFRTARVNTPVFVRNFLTGRGQATS